jgi:hypothetical protein
VVIPSLLKISLKIIEQIRPLLPDLPDVGKI